MDKRVASDSSTQLIPRPRRPPMAIEMALFFSARLSVESNSNISNNHIDQIRLYATICWWYEITQTRNNLWYVINMLQATCYIDSNQTSTVQRCPEVQVTAPPESAFIQLAFRTEALTLAFSSGRQLPNVVNSDWRQVYFKYATLSAIDIHEKIRQCFYYRLMRINCNRYILMELVDWRIVIEIDRIIIPWKECGHVAVGHWCDTWNKSPDGTWVCLKMGHKHIFIWSGPHFWWLVWFQHVL